MFQAWERSATHHHLMDLHGTYALRVVQDESKEYGTSSLLSTLHSVQDMACIVRVQRPTTDGDREGVKHG